MKKLIFAFMMVFAAMGANAQTAIETSNVFDNIYVGIGGGATSPLDFDKMFPINPTAGVKIGKEFSPILAFEVEGSAIFNDNHWAGPKTAVKATNVGLNGILNFSNIIGGYKGAPRPFEVKTNTGIGWLHVWDESENALTAKTGLDFVLNFGSSKAHSVVFTPAVYWNLNKYQKIKFDKRGGQLSAALSYIYHFKTSNGANHFKMYDVGAMMDEISALRAELDKKPTEVIKEVPVEKVVYKNVRTEYVVAFAKGSYQLSEFAKAVLNQVPKDVPVVIEATASPEGSAAFNKRLSDNRAANVADYLKGRGVNVKSADGLGVTGDDSQRIAKVIVQ